MTVPGGPTGGDDGDARPVRAIRVFVGLPSALQPFLSLDASARLYQTAADADMAVLPFDEVLQDALHLRFGTGDWPEGQSAMLSTTDLAFAADCSNVAPLAFIAWDTDAEHDLQTAATWLAGRGVMAPATLDLSGAGKARPRSLYPANMALRSLGVTRGDAIDECAAFGLDGLVDNTDIHDSALPW